MIIIFDSVIHSHNFLIMFVQRILFLFVYFPFSLYLSGAISVV